MAFHQLFHNIYYCMIIGILLMCFYYIALSLLAGDQLRFFAFTIDTIYLHWNTSFPAVTVCEIFNGEKTWDLCETYYGSDRNNKLDDFVSDIAFFNGKCYACSLCSTEINCPNNFTEIYSKFRSNCSEMIQNCYWNKKPIDCCQSFLPLQTEFGLCFSINSMHTSPPYGHQLIANRESGPGLLTFNTFEDVQVHVHATNEVPFGVEGEIKENIFFGSEKEIIVKVTEIVNDNTVRDVEIDQRKCRFASERPQTKFDSLYDYYSYSTCAIECAFKIQLECCNCIHHLMPRRTNNVNICDSEGLVCLTENFGKINSLRRKCDCMSSCEEPDYTTLFSSSNEKFRDDPGSLIKISMIDLPKERYVRRNVKSTLDHVISVGGVGGLFFGFSIISAIEFLVKFVPILLCKFIRSQTKQLKNLKTIVYKR